MRRVAIHIYRLRTLLVLLLAAAMAVGLLALVGTKLAQAQKALAEAAPVTFAQAQNYGVGDAPQAGVSSHFNADSSPDLAVVNFDTDDVSALLGNADGTFQTAQSFAAGDGPVHITSADFNGDLKPDLATANFNSDNVSVLLANGDGTFGTAINHATGDGPDSVTSADFNSDSKADLAVANYNSSSSANDVSILLGNGDGTFGTGTGAAIGPLSVCDGCPPPLPSLPTTVTSADYNGDSKADLAVSNGNLDNVYVRLGNGDGTFGTVRAFAVGDGPWSMTSADYNGDSKPDLAVTNNGLLTSFGNVSVLLGNGDGTFGSAQFYTAGTTPTGLDSADFDGDSRLDLAVGNDFSNNVSVLLGNGDGTFRTAQNFGVDDGPASVTAADFDGDSKPDLAIANTFSNDVSVLLNTTAPTVTDTTPAKGAAGVAPSINFITATFSTEINPDMLTKDSFKLYQYNKKKKRWIRITDTAVGCDTPCQTATLDPYPSDPSKPLAANKKYKAIITTGVTDKAGDPIASNYIWTFRTDSNT